MSELVSPPLPREVADTAAVAAVADARAMPDAFRDFMTVYLTGVAVVTSVDAHGRPRGMTCNSLTSVTLSPPTLLVCLAVGTGTLSAVRTRAGFVVNLLHERGRPAAELFSSRQPNRFDQVVWQPATTTGLPWLVDDACAMAECELTELKVVGDHAVVFGEVVNVEQGDGSPLVYGRRTYGGGLL